MLSILIPTHNVDVRHLVRDLLQQCRQLGAAFEIVVEEDGSTPDIQSLNAELDQEKEVTVVLNAKALGRSKVRNHLADSARYPYLLFMDCDANVKHSDYVSKYLQTIRTYADMEPSFAVPGGLAYHDQIPDDDHVLRWKYGIKREVRSATQRNLNPYAFFTPFNLLITKSVFDVCRFDESITTYGFEDTLFGEQLLQKSVPVHHIDNELYHDGIDENIIFLNKVQDSIDNLVKLYRDGKLPTSFVKNSKLLVSYECCKKWHLVGVITKCFNEKMLKKRLLNHASLMALDLLKLKWLCEKL